MSLILAIDTATIQASVALMDTNTGSCQQRESLPNRHTESVLNDIDVLLKQAELQPQQVDAIAFGAGPGGFTGLRVACGLAQGLAWGLEKPLLAVSNLEAAAHRLHRAGFQGQTLIALDARMSECYCQRFELTSAEVRPLDEPRLSAPEMLATWIEQDQVTVWAGSGFLVYAEVIGPVAQKAVPDFAVTASDIAYVATLALAQGNVTPVAAATPLYVRDRVALTIQERAQGLKL